MHGSLSMRRGDQEAFALLVRRYERKLASVLTRLIRNPEHARDLANRKPSLESVRLSRTFGYRPRFGPWLFRVAVNLALDWIRHSKHKTALTTSIHGIGVDEHEV